MYQTLLSLGENKGVYSRRNRAAILLNLTFPVALLSLIALTSTENVKEKSIHTVFTTECNTYFNWQTLGIVHSHKKSGQKGPITRLLSCTDEQLKYYKDVEGVPTHIAPSWSIHPTTGDHYSGINKPVAVRDWLEKANPPEDYILIIDSDTIMREGFDVDEFDLKPGWAVSGFYGYLKGVNNELAMKHIPEVPPRQDLLAGPKGRKSDQVGGFTFMSKGDLQKMANNWVTITEDIRADPDAWTLSGDVFTVKPGDKPWIAEMYGYSYAAAKADVWHHTNDRVMLYPGYLPLGINEPPKVLHYGIEYKVEDPPFSFDKHWYQEFDPLACPPWTKTNAAGRPTGGLFPNPPHPSKLKSKGLELLKDLLALETMATINEALCLRHTSSCPPSQELDTRCHEVFELAKAISNAQKQLSIPPDKVTCKDDVPDCSKWAASGECLKNPKYMDIHCRLSCAKCPDSAAPKEKAPTKTAPKNNQGVGDVHVISDFASEDLDLQTAADKMKRYSQACLSNTQLSMAQVKDCMRLAKIGKPFTLPKAEVRVIGRQARPNMAGEEVRKASPDVFTNDNARMARRLGERRQEISTGQHGQYVTLIILGLLVLALLALAKIWGALQRSSHRPYSRSVRRD